MKRERERGMYDDGNGLERGSGGHWQGFVLGLDGDVRKSSEL